MRNAHSTLVLAFAAVLSVAMTAHAQVNREPTEQEVVKRGPVKPEPGKPVNKILNEVEKAISKEIDLEKDQREEVEELFDDTRDRLAQQSAQSSGQTEENAEQVADLKDQMQKAREDKDWETFRELSKQMRELTQGQPNAVEVLRELHEGLKEILDKDQLEQLDAIISKHRGEYEHRFQDGMLKLMAMLQATEQLELDDQQTREMKDFKTEFMRDMKDLDKSDTAAMDRMYSERREDVVKILHDDQIKDFEKAEAQVLESMKGHKATKMGESHPRKGGPESKESKQAKKPAPAKAKADDTDDDDEDEEEDEEDSE